VQLGTRLAIGVSGGEHVVDSATRQAGALCALRLSCWKCGSVLNLNSQFPFLPHGQGTSIHPPTHAGSSR
jgi:hypothetical protein